MSVTETDPQVVEEVIFDALVAMGPERSNVARESTFEALDLDSLDLVEIAQVVEEKWGVELDPQNFTNCETVGEALDLIMAQLP
jgi:acyl carrier protein